jgi:glutathione S-transferase
MTDIEIYSAVLCPFAHRSRLVLLEKNIPFNLTEIDVRNKPANFLEISPNGKVPLLRHGHNRIWESAVINEYLEDAFPEPALLPKDPFQRALARIWIGFADTRLYVTTAKLLHGQGSPPSLLLNELNDHLHRIEHDGLAKISDGTYWLGAKSSLVDFTFYAWFEQICVLEYFLDFKFPTGFSRIEKWVKSMTDRYSVQAIAKSPEFYLEHYGRIIQAGKA